MRKPVAAGQFYPADKAGLKEQISNFVKKEQDSKIKAAIVPHAGYVFSGKCAGKVYSLLPEAQTYVLAGVNHSGLGEDIAISPEDFETPLGIVKNDAELSREIAGLLSIREDNEAHKHEHSIEVQLPFLQASQENFKIVPIILKNYNFETCKKLAKAIFESAKKLKRKIICIASSDFTHSGANYGFQGSKELDKEAINKILKLDSAAFLRAAEQTTICGAGAIATCMEFAKLSGAKKAKLLEYYTSADIMPNESWVGYAGIVFS